MKREIIEGNIEIFSTLVKLIFSWLVILPAATIIAGKLLTKPIPFSTDTKQLLRIPLKIFTLEATDGEVIVGFAAQLITFFFVAIIGGKNVHSIVQNNFGVDPGQFHSIFLFSALLTVLWASFIFLCHHIGNLYLSSTFTDNSKKHARIIEELAKKEENKK